MKYYSISNGNVVISTGDNLGNIVVNDEPSEIIHPIEVQDETDEHYIHIRKVGNFVKITIPNHPMLDVHRILFIALQTNLGFHLQELNDHTTAQVEFVLARNEKVISIIAACSVHMVFSMSINS